MFQLKSHDRAWCRASPYTFSLTSSVKSTLTCCFPHLSGEGCLLYVSSCPPPPAAPPRPLRRPQPRASAGSVPGRPQLRGSFCSVPLQTSTASAGWCSSPDLNRGFWLAVFPVGLQPAHNHKHTVTTTQTQSTNTQPQTQSQHTTTKTHVQYVE